MPTDEALTLYIGAFIDELTHQQVTDVVISPGSRSTPIALLMAEHPHMNVWLNIDERSAAFFALGMSKAKRKPVALLCTSGTAAANYYPAIAEAKLSRVPLLVLTADRPHELREVGAPQAMDQINMYGSHVKWSMDMALPQSDPGMIDYIRTKAARAAHLCQTIPAGPVHLNFPLREPLIPDVKSVANVFPKRREQHPHHVIVNEGTLQLNQSTLQSMASTLYCCERPLIVCGPIDKTGFSEAVTRLAVELNIPVLADPLSQLRCGTHNQALIIDSYDVFLRDDQMKEWLKPDLIIRFGAMPVSKVYLQYMQMHADCEQIIIDEAGWRDPTLLTSEMIYAEPVQLCHQLTRFIKNIADTTEATNTSYTSDVSKVSNSFKDVIRASNSAHHNKDIAVKSVWTERWKKLNFETKAATLQLIEQFDQTFEGRLFTELSNTLKESCTLYVANSMPIRDMDSFFYKTEVNVRVLANRGANGIDGMISSALGASTVDNHPHILILGDLSFFHDLNGLLASKLHQLNLTIVLVNNDGGGIFSFLPQAEHPKHFEELFGTPHGLQFKHVVNMYGATYNKMTHWDSFSDLLKEGMSAEGVHVIEINTDRHSNVTMHRDVWKHVSEVVSSKVKISEVEPTELDNDAQ